MTDLFLIAKGEGVHHIAFEVKDTAQVVEGPAERILLFIF
jgi:hypothetical protein